MPDVTPGERGISFGGAVRRRLDDMGRSQTWLGERLGEMHGRRPYGQSTVGTWLARTEITPALVFDIERALELEPGSLSRILGYVPADVVKMSAEVPEAIEADPMLDERGRRSLLAAYRVLVER